MQLRTDYGFADAGAAERFAVDQLEALPFAAQAVARGWKRLERDNDAGLLQANRVFLLDYIGAAYALQASAEFAEATAAYLSNSPGKVRHFSPAPGELFADLCLAVALADQDTKRACVEKRLSKADLGTGPAPGSSLLSLAEDMLCRMLVGAHPSAKRLGDILLEACASREHPQLPSRYFAYWARCALALVERDPAGFVGHMNEADAEWVLHLDKQLKRVRSGQPADIGGASFVDLGRAALWAMASDKLGAPAIEAGARRFVDVAWMRAGA